MIDVRNIAIEGTMYVVLFCAFFATRTLRLQCCALADQVRELQHQAGVLQGNIRSLTAEQDKLSHPESIKNLITKHKIPLKPISNS